jgi:hypothetical protein
LQGGSYAQTDQADEQRPAAGGIRLEGVIDLVAGVVGVPAEQLREAMAQPAEAARSMIMMLAVIVAVVVTVTRLAGASTVVGMAHLAIGFVDGMPSLYITCADVHMCS